MKQFFSNFKGDLFGGVTAGVVALPLALAFGVSSGMGPSAGLYGAIFISFFAALFGGTNTQISGPTAPMTAVTMVLVASVVAAFGGDLQEALPSILFVFLLAGVMQIGLGLLKVGQFIRYIPYPVVSGFMTAIGVIILITQLFPMLGYYPKEDAELATEFRSVSQEVILNKMLKEEAGDGVLVLEDFKGAIARAEKITMDDIEKEAAIQAKNAASGVKGTIFYAGRAFKNIDWLELALGVITIVIIYGFKKVTTVIPSTLVALVAVTAGAYFLGLDYRPIQEIPAGFPELRLELFSGFKFSAVSPYIFTAFTLALLGSIDSLLTSVVADNLTKTRHEPNKELVGQGIGNGVAALFGGIPGAGATIRTVVNINSGGKTRLSGMVAGLLLLFILLAMGPVASQIPAAVLAGILVTVGIGVMDYKGLRAARFMPVSEVIIMVVVLLLAVFWNLVYAVGIGLVLASIVFMKKMGDVTAGLSRVLPLETYGTDKSLDLDHDGYKDVFIKRLQGPLFFGFTSEFQDMAEQIPAEAQWVIIRMKQVPYMDQSGVYALEDVVRQLTKSSRKVLFTGLQERPLAFMEKANIFKGLDNDVHFFDHLNDALRFIKEKESEKTS
ncbi:SulP family inorganic anion transporter [Robertkochia sediminum]|uniref:SulP family inorganic anion transporter n=1 Tax=Robertkochia sediminum TaxID=2785326 RepID=UPI00193231D5|nr:SulP family inorganic anion transporter [Robertkochia sediminum]MBL7471902.1 SulP family inorganic anion transporter [Robertkochia sediminum]